ncbi:lysM domain-containing protein [Colletotrichum tofieldiae]|nr:LysM domain-containing protein [Colletotrichum tofieldiae]GKT76025.1 lysM domain-containing protein [Colletotrichum tofieldiae]
MKIALQSVLFAQLLAFGAAQFTEPPPSTADPSTITDCTWWFIAGATDTCDGVTAQYGLTKAQLVRYNPILSSSCSFVAGNSYCIEKNWGSDADPAPEPLTTTTVATPTTFTTSTKEAASTTTPGNGVVTPQPTQPGMVTNCNKFHWIAKGVGCSAVISYQKITREDFVRWNPTVLDDCSGMWAEVNVCVGVIGGATTTAKPTTSTTTSAGNGVTTPQPTQPGMVTNCNKFHWIAKGVGCSAVISYQKITREDFVRWNPTVLDDCSGMWAEVNVCVGVIGGAITTATTKPTATTTAGNGVTTPQPTQPGMVTNCNKFHWIAKGVGCSAVISYQKITREDFVRWNPTVLDDCSGMWAEVNVCVGVIGGAITTTTTKPTTTTSVGNGVATPQPTQPGMVTNCKKFHYVAEGVVCSQIISYQKITLADFVKWNTGVGANCQNMWAKTNVCVGV